ncbi:MAG: FtsW/RodA/SpoVE family cell cycle protein [Thermoanaerobaculia bacterium]
MSSLARSARRTARARSVRPLPSPGDSRRCSWIQAPINISVAIALLPDEGIPLPFLSYGGSSLVVTMMICGVLLNVSQNG